MRQMTLNWFAGRHFYSMNMPSKVLVLKLLKKTIVSYHGSDFARSTFLETRGLVKALVRLLSHDDTCIPRIVIRALKNLSIDNPQFQDLLIKNGVTSRVVSFLRDSDSAYETQYWAVVFFHMLLANGMKFNLNFT